MDKEVSLYALFHAAAVEEHIERFPAVHGMGGHAIVSQEIEVLDMSKAEITGPDDTDWQELLADAPGG